MEIAQRCWDDAEARSGVCLVPIQSCVPQQSRHEQEQSKPRVKLFSLLLAQADTEHNLIYNYKKIKAVSVILPSTAGQLS